MVVNDTGQTINFSGYHTNASAPVRVKAYNFGSRRYDVVASGVSSGSPIPSAYWGDPSYAWWAPSRVIASQYWEPGRCAGARALFKGETDVGGSTYGMYSWNLERNAEGCMERNRNNADWVNNCSSNYSEVTTRDYTNAPRAFGVNVNYSPDANASCTGLTFTYSHPTGEWSGLRATLSAPSIRTVNFSCTPTSESRGTTYGRCGVAFGSIARVRDFIEALQWDAATLQITARDERCLDRLGVSQTYTIRSSLYDYYWPRWSGTRTQCTAPPPPPPVDDPRNFDVSCFCSNVGGVRSTVRLEGCINNVSSSAVSLGASVDVRIRSGRARDFESIGYHVLADFRRNRGRDVLSDGGLAIQSLTGPKTFALSRRETWFLESAALYFVTSRGQYPYYCESTRLSATDGPADHRVQGGSRHQTTARAKSMLVLRQVPRRVCGRIWPYLGRPLDLWGVPLAGPRRPSRPEDSAIRFPRRPRSTAVFVLSSTALSHPYDHQRPGLRHLRPLRERPGCF